MDPNFVVLQGKNIVCKKHLEGVTRPHEIAQFFNLMIKETIEDELFKGFCGRNEAEGTPASIQKIPEVLESVLPLCCFLRDKKVEEIKLKIKACTHHPPKPNVAERLFTPVEFIKFLGWKPVDTFTDKTQAVSYAKGFSDARRKLDVVILDLTDPSSGEHRFDVWTRKIEDGSSFPN